MEDVFFNLLTTSIEGIWGIVRACTSEAFSLESGSFLREGSLGGREGLCGGVGFTSFLVVAGVTTTPVVEPGTRLTYFGFSSEYFLVTGGGGPPLGGRTGSSPCPQAGALTRLAVESPDFVRDPPDDELSCVPSEEVDEVRECVLDSSSDDEFLLGSGGGCFLASGAGGGGAGAG